MTSEKFPESKFFNEAGTHTAFSLEISLTRYQVKESTYFSQLDFTSIIERWHLPLS